jgi:hypothetical protein
MTSQKRIHCWIVVVPETTALATRPAYSRRAADPHILGLIAKLQAEVREERHQHPAVATLPVEDRFARQERQEHAEAEITWRDWPLDFSEPDFDAWERGAEPLGGRWSLPR